MGFAGKRARGGLELPDNRYYRVIIVIQQVIEKEVPLSVPERTPPFHSLRFYLFCLIYGYIRKSCRV